MAQEDFILGLANALLTAGANSSQAYSNRQLTLQQQQREDAIRQEQRQQQVQDQNTQRQQQLGDFATQQRLQQLAQLQQGLAYLTPNDPLYTQAQQAIAALENQTGLTGQDAVNALFNSNVQTQQYTPGQTQVAQLPADMQAMGYIPTRTVTPGQTSTVNKSVNQVLGDLARNQLQSTYAREDTQSAAEQQARLDYLSAQGLQATDIEKLRQAWQTGERESSQVWQDKVLKMNFSNDLQKQSFLNLLAKDLESHSANIKSTQDIESYWRTQFDTIGADATTGKFSEQSIINRYKALADSKDPSIPSYLKEAAQTAVDNGGFFPDAARTLVEQQIQSNIESIKQQRTDNYISKETADARIAQENERLNIMKNDVKIGDQQIQVNALTMDYQTLVNRRYELETYNWEVNSAQDYVKKAIDSGSYESINSLIVAKTDPTAEGVTDAQRKAVENVSLSELERARDTAVKVNNVNSYSYKVAYETLQNQSRTLQYGNITAKTQLINTVAQNMTPEQIANIENDPVIRSLMADGRLNANDIEAMKSLATTRGLIEQETINAPQVQRYSQLLTTTHLIAPDTSNPTAVANAEASLRGTLDKLVQLNAMDANSVEGIVSAYKNAWSQGNDQFAMQMALTQAQVGQMNAAASLSRAQASGAGKSGGYGGLTPNQYFDGFNAMTDDMQTALNQKYKSCFVGGNGDALNLNSGAKTPEGIDCKNYNIEQGQLNQTRINFYANYYDGYLPGLSDKQKFDQWTNQRSPQLYNFALSQGATEEAAKSYAVDQLEYEGQQFVAGVLNQVPLNTYPSYNPDLPNTTYNMMPIQPSFAAPETLRQGYYLPGVTPPPNPQTAPNPKESNIQPSQPQEGQIYFPMQFPPSVRGSE